MRARLSNEKRGSKKQKAIAAVLQQLRGVLQVVDALLSEAGDD